MLDEKPVKAKKIEKDKTLSILLLRGPYVSEYAEIAAKLALTARKKGYKTNMFLYLDAAWLQHIKEFKEFSNPGDWLKRAMRKGVSILNPVPITGTWKVWCPPAPAALAWSGPSA